MFCGKYAFFYRNLPRLQYLTSNDATWQTVLCDPVIFSLHSDSFNTAHVMITQPCFRSNYCLTQEQVQSHLNRDVPTPRVECTSFPNQQQFLQESPQSRANHRAQPSFQLTEAPSGPVKHDISTCEMLINVDNAMVIQSAVMAGYLSQCVIWSTHRAKDHQGCSCW